jgi:hypothetical protein
MEKGFFHPDRGYWQTLSEPTDATKSHYPDGTIEVPLKPSHLHIWDGSDWVAPTQAEIDADVAANVRSERDGKLRFEVDPIVSNPLRWADMSADEQQAWSDYRDALLNVPQQAGFPHQVDWPAKP